MPDTLPRRFEVSSRSLDRRRGFGAENAPKSAAPAIEATYLLPIRATDTGGLDELTAYLSSLPTSQTIVVDGSPPAIFALHAARWRGVVTHLAPEFPTGAANGKVAGVLTGLRAAHHDRVVVADDDVRYDPAMLARVVKLLDQYDIVRPQNYFDPLPWHAVLDTSRTLLNRVSGGDWPGTLAFHRSALPPNGYRADVLFENLELVRTVRAGGGREAVALDAYVRRLAPSAQHYASQRVRQAYDEWARPARLAAALAILPLATACVRNRWWTALATGAVLAVAAAEAGRRRAGGASVFPVASSLSAPMWLVERGVCAWIALFLRLRGGVRYGSVRLRDAATSEHDLRRQRAAMQQPREGPT